MPIGSLVVSVYLVAAGVVWSAYDQFGRQRAFAEPPLVRAKSTALKISPFEDANQTVALLPNLLAQPSEPAHLAESAAWKSGLPAPESTPPQVKRGDGQAASVGVEVVEKDAMASTPADLAEIKPAAAAHEPSPVVVAEPGGVITTRSSEPLSSWQFVTLRQAETPLAAAEPTALEADDVRREAGVAADAAKLPVVAAVEPEPGADSGVLVSPRPPSPETRLDDLLEERAAAPTPPKPLFKPQPDATTIASRRIKPASSPLDLVRNFLTRVVAAVAESEATSDRLFLISSYKANDRDNGGNGDGGVGASNGGQGGGGSGGSSSSGGGSSGSSSGGNDGGGGNGNDGGGNGNDGGGNGNSGNNNSGNNNSGNNNSGNNNSGNNNSGNNNSGNNNSGNG